MNLGPIVCSALLMSGLASAAWARDVCLQNSGTDFIVLKKVKSLHPGGSVPLNGFRYYVVEGHPSPLDGSAVMKSCGAMKYDVNGDFSSDGQAIWEPVDCKDVPLP